MSQVSDIAEAPNAGIPAVRGFVLSRKLELGLVLLIALLSFLIRAYGINFGLPYLYDPDEQAFVTPALNMLATRDFNPHYFPHPGSTTMYMLAGAYALTFGVSLVLGKTSNPAAFQAAYYQDPSLIYLVGRLEIAIFGVLTVLLVYLIARRLFNPVVGLCAAILTALIPIHVATSRLIRTDVEMGFFVLVAFWFCLNLVSKRTWLNYILAGTFVGVATMTKYPAAIFFLTIVAAHCLVTAQPMQLKNHLKLMSSGAASIVTAFICSPFLFLDFPQALRDLQSSVAPEHLSAAGQGLIENLVWYFQVLKDNLTPIALILLGFGLVFCLISKNKGRVLLPIFPIAFLVLISVAHIRWDRWIVPIIPFLAIIVSFGVYQTALWLAQQRGKIVGVSVGVAAMALMVVPAGSSDLSIAATIAGGDTRTIARQWILDNLPRGSNLLVETYTPQLPKDSFNYYRIVEGKPQHFDASHWNQANFHPGGHIGRLVDLGVVETNNIQYLVLSNIYQRYLAEKDTYPSQVRVYEQLIASGKLLYEINAIAGQRGGPSIQVYQIDQALLKQQIEQGAIDRTPASTGDLPDSEDQP